MRSPGERVLDVACGTGIVARYTATLSLGLKAAGSLSMSARLAGGRPRPSRTFRTVGKHFPPPPGIKPPPLWGTEEQLGELFGDGISSLETTRRTYVFRYPSAPHFIEYFCSYYGPMNKAFESLDEDGREALAQDLEKLLEEWNTSDGGTLVVPSEFLEVVAVRR